MSLIQVELAKVTALCKLMQCLVLKPGNIDFRQDSAKYNPIIATTFAFCYLWTIGGNVVDTNWDAFDTFLRQTFESCPDVKVSEQCKSSFFVYLPH